MDELLRLNLHANMEAHTISTFPSSSSPAAESSSDSIPIPPPLPKSIPSFKRVTAEKKIEFPNNSVRQIMKELKEMNEAHFDEEQVRVEMVGDDPFSLLITLTPNDGLYQDGEYEIEMKIPDTYPRSKPSFTCKSQIFHPNVDYSGKICFSLLDESDSNLRIADYAHGMLWLLYYPNLWSRLNMDCPRDEKKFAEMVRTSIVGGVVEGKSYARSKKLVREDEKRKGEENGDKMKEEMDLQKVLQKSKNGKTWVWTLVGEEWVQKFVDGEGVAVNA